MINDDLKLPAKISLIYTTRSKVRDVLMYCGFREIQEFNIADVSELFNDLMGCFPSACRGSPLFMEALHRSLENYLIGAKYTPRLETTIIAVLAGNIHTMASGRFLAPPASKSSEDYCLASVTNVYPTSTSCNTDFNILIEVITGPIAGYEMEFPIRSESMLYKLLSTAGLTTRGAEEGSNYIHPRFLSGCFLFVIPTEEDDRVFVRDLGASSALKSRNKTLYKARIAENRCHNNFEWQCSVCPVGLVNCALATHPLNCIRAKCPLCGEEEWLDPQNQHVASFDCQDRLWYV